MTHTVEFAFIVDKVWQSLLAAARACQVVVLHLVVQIQTVLIVVPRTVLLERCFKLGIQHLVFEGAVIACGWLR